MNVEQLAQSFWRDGYLILEDFFDLVQMDALQDSILQYFGGSPAVLHNQEFLNKSATEVIPWFPQREGVRIFDQVDDDARLVALSQAILGDGWQALYCMAMFSEKGTKGQAWHQDCPPEDPRKFNLNRLVYTMDVGGELGGEILVMPGSHKRGELTVGDVVEEVAVSAPVVHTTRRGR
jgi:ectoine hydroxylase